MVLRLSEIMVTTYLKVENLCKILGFHGGDHEERRLLA
jgi:hypothetical protein